MLDPKDLREKAPDATLVVLTTNATGDHVSTDEMVSAERTSATIWDTIPDDGRKVLAKITKDALADLAANPDIWLPTSLDADNGTYFTVQIGIHLDEVLQDVTLQRIADEVAAAEPEARSDVKWALMIHVPGFIRIPDRTETIGPFDSEDEAETFRTTSEIAHLLIDHKVVPCYDPQGMVDYVKARD